MADTKIDVVKYAPMRPHLRSAAFALALAGLLAVTSGAHAAESRYAGTYTTTRPGADSTQALTLVLDRSGRATLTTRFPDLERRYGRGVLPIREFGAWRDRGSTAEVRFAILGLVRNGQLTKASRESKALRFTLRRCRLTAVQYSKLLYGEAGLNFNKSACKG